MKQTKNIFLLTILIASSMDSTAQCADPANIYLFEYEGHLYEVVKENETWTQASLCAVSHNGYLAEITTSDEQDAIFDELVNNAGINTSDTENQFGTASVWIGGSDAVTEGNWIWDGNNDGLGPQFWSGGPGGTPVGGFYSNWGVSPPEPDNSGDQDHLCFIIHTTATNFGLWNDLVSTNSLYYLIEHDNTLSIHDLKLEPGIHINPNPFEDLIYIHIEDPRSIVKMEILALNGQRIKSFDPSELINNELDVSLLGSGMYVLNVYFNNGKRTSEKIVKY